MKNISEILKDCPKGTKLYSPIFGECTLSEVTDYTIRVLDSDNKYYNFYLNGYYVKTGECMLFPSKENRDWSIFQRPFKDGDIVFYNDTISIFKEWGDETLFRAHACTYLCMDILDINMPLFGKSIKKEIRFATEEEKKKLFDVIKENGYKWNAETTKLEKLIKIPKFTVGDRIKQKGSPRIYIITTVEYDRYILHNGQFVKFINEDIYELDLKFDISTLKPFDKVLVRDNNNHYWRCNYFSHINKPPFIFTCTDGNWKQCIPYEGNEHLVGTTDDCDEYYKNW